MHAFKKHLYNGIERKTSILLNFVGEELSEPPDKRRMERLGKREVECT